MSGARGDMLNAFRYVSQLQHVTTRMETFINSNDLLKQTQLPNIFHEGELQKKVDTFLEMVQSQHGEDPQFKHTQSQTPPTATSKSIESQAKTTRIAGWATKMYNWVRDHEVQQLQEDFENAIELVSIISTILMKGGDSTINRSTKRY